MGTSQIVLVHFIGIEQKEAHFMKIVFKLSESREREYHIVQDNGNQNDNFNKADIVIVDKDSGASIRCWKEHLENDNFHQQKSTLFLTQNKADTAKNTTHKPLVALRLLKALDQVQIIKNNENATRTDDSPAQLNPQPHLSEQNTVLVIDDSLAVREHIGHELNKYHCHVDFASNAEEGYWSIQKNPYSLVFLDIILPGMNGHQLCKDIKSNKLLRDTPIVMLTSKSSPFDRVKGRLSGCNDYLTKPVKAGKLHQIIEKYLIDEKAIAQ